MSVEQPLALLGGLTPRRFMQRHWQKKPLLVRAAIDGFRTPVDRSALFALAGRDDVAARLIESDGSGTGWRLSSGPFVRRALPALKTPGWTLLVQGVDRQHDAAHALLQRFRFIPDARLDDLMISYASDQGGVGAHADRYDVFLLQAQGRRRWRIARPGDGALRPGLPLKLLASFEPHEEHLLDPGDMLYLPPGWGHEGTAVGGDCITCSIGFRAPERHELARELLQRLADAEPGSGKPVPYRDAAQSAVEAPAAIPAALAAFAERAVRAALREPEAIGRALGAWVSEPDASVWFEPADGESVLKPPLRLDRRTRMLYDERHIYINGDSQRVGAREAAVLRRLADARELDAHDLQRCPAGVRARLAEWLAAGWLHGAAEQR